MKYLVEPVELQPGETGGNWNLPYACKVNGSYLLDKRRRVRRFGDSITAAIAGAKEVDRLKAEARR